MIGPRMDIGITHAPLMLLVATPVAVALSGVGVFAILSWLLCILFFNILLNLRSLRQPEKYQLESVAGSHYVEFVRWSLDALKEPYEEVECVGVIGLLLFGRSVPALHVPKHRTAIGNSRDIVRYLYGKYASEERAAFLKPAGGEAAVLEDQIEMLGACARQWLMYYNFSINESGYRRSVAEIDKTFEAVDNLLADGRKYLLNTSEKTYLDIYLASMAAPALRPPEYSGGCLEPESRVTVEEVHPRARNEIESWRKRPTGQFVLRLFAEERGLSNN